VSYQLLKYKLNVTKIEKIEKIDYFAIRGGSRKKIAKKIIPKVPISKNV
jgi:hypothetical protein